MIIHHEPDGISTRTAGEAVKEGSTFVRDDRERRLGVVMKRTHTDMLAPLWVEGDVLADQLHEIGGFDDPISFVIFKSS